MKEKKNFCSFHFEKQSHWLGVRTGGEAVRL